MIEVGEYVRNRRGIIRRVETIKSGKRQFTRTTETLINGKFKLEDIIKHSKNIIDLIEVGDYVNGERILDITGEYIRTNETTHNIVYLTKHIKTILTHEQYAQNCYKVEV